MKDLALIEQLPGNIMGQTICALGDAAAMPVQSFVKKFRHEFVEHIEGRGCKHGETAWGVSRESREALVGGNRHAVR
jgi:NADH-quinone oxidoreductase subunit F